MHAMDPGFSSRPRQAKKVSDVGALIGDRYRIEGLIREDAMTSTVSARHLALEERVFVQVLRPEARFDKRRTVQYLKAIKSLARIKTDHVVRVLDVGVALFLGPFLVMEELEGSTLAEVLRAEGPPPLPRAVDYVLQACKGLAMAHAAGVVHAQLDTRRLLLARRGAFETLKVIDFPTLGVAAADAPYLAPEVIGGVLPGDGRADVWSLGAVLFELVSGRPALSSASASAEIDDKAALSPALRRIIARCLQPDPAQRFGDVDELAAELLPLTTLNEVFRGSLTGSFSRQMMIAAAARARAEASVERRAPARGQVRRARLTRVRSRLPQLDWRAGWRALDRSWTRAVPEGPPLQRAALGIGAGLLIALATSAGLGHVRLVPPARVPAPRIALEALPERAPEALPPLELAPVPGGAPVAGEARVESVNAELAAAPGQAAVEAPKRRVPVQHRRHKSRSAQRHQ
ncbi:MAG TPA: serine/threonine-protein kinase [Polyangiaceae bacterium]|nr:serine/threonine-protein kinase [Polyangiaceae bacterium]